MEQAAKSMNIKGHYVGSDQEKLIYGPGDIEGHLGSDGRFYLLDFARYSPPEPPTKDKGSILYRLLRPSLVKSSPKPLSPDAFSMIGKHDNQIHNAEVREVYRMLLEEIIPSFAASLRDHAQRHRYELRQELIEQLQDIQKKLVCTMDSTSLLIYFSFSFSMTQESMFDI